MDLPVKARSRYYMNNAKGRLIRAVSRSPSPASRVESVPETSASSENGPYSSVVFTEEILPLGAPIEKSHRPGSKEAFCGEETQFEKILQRDFAGDVAETEKLAWTQTTDSTAPEREISGKKDEKRGFFEARFDQAGNILAPDSKIPVTAGLHHHGDEPGRPGYNLDEIYTYLQSSNQAQKLWALDIMNAIIRNAKSSIYDGVLEESLLEKMNKEGMLLPLRHLLDDPALPVVRGAVKVLESLFVNDVDEFMLDQLLIADKNPIFFELNPLGALEQDDLPVEEELKDAQLTELDVVKGYLRTSILRRFEVLLVSFMAELDTAAVSSILAIVTRFARHSDIVATRLIKTGPEGEGGNLMQLLMSPLVTSKNPLAQMKLLRILTAVLGPQSHILWAERIYLSTAGWIACLRTVIDDTVTRDMVTESLNLLIVLGHYGLCPASISGVEDVFPQVLHSAGPKADGKITKWDADCCSRMLTFLSLCLPLRKGNGPLISVAMTTKIMENAVTGYFTVEHSDPKEIVEQLQASYLLFATAYGAYNGAASSRLLSPLSQIFLRNHSEKLLSLLDLAWIFHRKPARHSPADPKGLPSYSIVQRAGQSVVPLFRQLSKLAFALQASRFLNSSPLEWKLHPSVTKKFNSQLEKIPSLRIGKEDFWSFYYVRVLLEIVKCGLVAFKAKMDVKYNLLYRAAFFLVPLLDAHQSADLKLILTDLIFSVSLLPAESVFLYLSVPGGASKPSTGSNSEDMQSIRLIFSNLRPLGFDEESQLPLTVPSRTVGVFTKTWIFDCFSYVVDWGKALDKVQGTKETSVNQCVRGYFYWLVQITDHILSGTNPTLSPFELFVSLSEFFTEEGYYRDDVVSWCVEAILRRLVTGPEKLLIKPDFVFKKRAFDDIYDSLLDEYAATSYNNPAFAQYILIPLQQEYDPVFRIKVWGAEKRLFAIIKIHPKDLCYPVELHLEPAEKDLALLKIFTNQLMQQVISEKRTPMLYLLCIHHLNHWLLAPATDSPEAARMRKALLNYLRTHKSDGLAQDILRYYRPAPPDKPDRVVGLFDGVPEVWDPIL